MKTLVFRVVSSFTNFDNNWFLSLSVCFVLVCFGCEEFVEVDPPDTSLAGETVFGNDNDAQAVLAGMYSDLVRSNVLSSNQGISIHCGRTSDIFLNFSATEENIEFFENELIPQNRINQVTWESLYQTIYRTNTILDKVASSSALSDSLTKQFEGEAKFLRAFSYFYLVNLWGDVPIALTSAYQENATLPRSPIEEVYNRAIIPDLLDAQSLLPGEYYSQDGLRSRPNRSAVTALLAKVYLYREDWQNAEDQATRVIDNELYALEGSLDDVFLTQSREVIWHLQNIFDFLPTYEGIVYILNFGPPRNVSLRDDFITEFDPSDQRLASWIGSVTAGSTTYYYPFKYKIMFGSGAPVELHSILRLAEIYLIRAEARARQNNLNGGLEDLNSVRTRAGLPGIDVSSQGDLLAAILMERKFELFSELGNRWLDLKRTGQASEVLSSIKPGWQETDELWPVPMEEFDNNPNLGQQNRGY